MFFLALPKENQRKHLTIKVSVKQDVRKGITTHNMQIKLYRI